MKGTTKPSAKEPAVTAERIREALRRPSRKQQEESRPGAPFGRKDGIHPAPGHYEDDWLDHLPD